MINGYGPVFGNFGYAVHARNFFRALNRKHPVCLCSVGGADIRSLGPEFIEMAKRISSYSFTNPSISISYGDDMHLFNGTPLIAFPAFEFSRLPETWSHMLRQMDEVWVPSQWGKEILAAHGIEESRCTVIPEGFDPAIFYFQEKVENKRFTFVSVGKWEKRKGQIELLEVWKETFEGNDEVELQVLWDNPFLSHFSVEKEMRKLGFTQPENLRLLHYSSSEAYIAKLYQQADCFVLPTRAEAWGLPICEAMACGLPVITLNYSGIREYANSDIAYLIDVKQEIPIDDFRYYPPNSGMWAEIDQEQLRHWMLHVYENRSEAKEKGRLAAEEMRAHWTWDHAADKALQRLRKIGAIT